MKCAARSLAYVDDDLGVLSNMHLKEFHVTLYLIGPFENWYIFLMSQFICFQNHIAVGLACGGRSALWTV